MPSLRRGTVSPKKIYRNGVRLKRIMRGTIQTWIDHYVDADYYYPLNFSSDWTLNQGRKDTRLAFNTATTFGPRDTHAFVNGATSRINVTEPWNGAWSFSAWFERTSSTTGSDGIFERSPGTTSIAGPHFRCYTASSTSAKDDLHWRISDGSTYSSENDIPGVLPTSGWFHFAVTSHVDAGRNRLRFYVNGVMVKDQHVSETFAPLVFTSAQWVTVGNITYSNFPWGGHVDDIALWPRTLSAAEVAAIHAGGRNN